eukprot:c7465_g1_i1 orf=278-436(+)
MVSLVDFLGRPLWQNCLHSYCHCLFTYEGLPYMQGVVCLLRTATLFYLTNLT